MKIKRMLMGAVCCLAFEGAFAQSPDNSASKLGNATCSSGCASVSTQKYGSSSAKQLLDRLSLNIYDMRLTAHEDGYIYGVFCAERHDDSQPGDLSAATATAAIARTKDLVNWE